MYYMGGVSTHTFQPIQILMATWHMKSGGVKIFLKILMAIQGQNQGVTISFIMVGKYFNPKI